VVSLKASRFQVLVVLEKHGADQAFDDRLVRSVSAKSVHADHLDASFALLSMRSRGFVTGMRIVVPMFGHDQQIVAYGATIRDRGTGSTKVRAGRSIR
jgi:hypothetical protein